MPREAWVFDLRNAYHQKQKTYIKHSSGLHPGETFYLIGHLHDDIIYYYDQNPSGFSFLLQIAAFII